MCKKNKKMAEVAIVHAITKSITAKNVCVAHVLDKQVIMRKKDVELGDKVILIKAGSICPKKRWSSFLYKWYGSGKVRRHKFRKMNSDCIALPVSNFPELQGKQLIKGQDVTDLLGIKYV